jgi:hypothetical protein
MSQSGPRPKSRPAAGPVGPLSRVNPSRLPVAGGSLCDPNPTFGRGGAARSGIAEFTVFHNRAFPTAHGVFVCGSKPGSVLSKVERDTDVRARDAGHHAILPTCQRKHNVAMDHRSVTIIADTRAANAELAG